MQFIISMILAMVGIFLTIIGIALTLLSIKRNNETQMALQEISSLANHALNEIDDLLEIRKSIESIDRIVNLEALGNRILSVRDRIEHRVRQISLFTKNEQLISASLFYFAENSTPEDRLQIKRALKFKYIRRHADRSLAEKIINNRSTDDD